MCFLHLIVLSVHFYELLLSSKFILWLMIMRFLLSSLTSPADRRAKVFLDFLELEIKLLEVEASLAKS